MEVKYPWNREKFKTSKKIQRIRLNWNGKEQ